MSTDLASIRQALREALPRLAARYDVETLAVFGSIARGDARESSDVDLLVSFSGEPPGLFGFLGLERELSDLLGRSVDLVMETGLRPQLREIVLAESVAA